jgi:hypothetical protein
VFLQEKMLRWSLVAAVNDEYVLETSLLRSPDIADATDICFQRGFSSAATAYNAALDGCRGDVVVCVHQDVFLPAGWIERLKRQVEQVERIDPRWGVIGVYGLDMAARPCGHVHSTGLKRTLGTPEGLPARAIAIDEMVIVLRRSAGLRFDAKLPGFHLYGTDICLEAERRDLSTFVVANFCVHNSNGLAVLPWAFWESYWFLRGKWRSRLPVKSPCATVHRSAARAAYDMGRGFLVRRLRPVDPGRRVVDPSRLCSDLLAAGHAALGHTR